MEWLKVLVGLVVSVATVFISYNTYTLNQKTNEANAELARIKQQLDGQRFGFDRLKDIYDRTQKYLSDKDQNERWGRALVVLIGSLPEEDIRRDLAGIIQAESTSASVVSGATDVLLRGSDPIVPRAIEDYRAGFLFSQGDPGKTDVTVYVCEGTDDLQRTVAIATQAGTALSRNNRFGRVKGGLWRDFDGYVPVTGTLAIVVDLDHPEVGEYDTLRGILGPSARDLEITRLANPGSRSPWLISLIACA